MGPLAAGIVGSAVPAIAGLFGGERRNRIDQREAQKSRDFQSAQAGRQMAFQERMRNTSWQAAVADMEAAGINPALAYSQGGAASPGGASGSGAQASGALDTISSAMQMTERRRGLDLLGEQIGKTTQEHRAAKATADVAEKRAEYLTKGRRMADGAGPPLLRELVMAEVDQARHGATNLAAQTQRNRNIAKLSEPMAEIMNKMAMPLLNMFIKPEGAASQFWNKRANQRKYSPLGGRN